MDMVDYFMALLSISLSISKFDGWALIEAWAATGMNKVIFKFQNFSFTDPKFARM